MNTIKELINLKVDETKISNKIKKFNNIFSEEQRKQIIEDSKSLLKTMDVRNNTEWVGKQTDANLFSLPQFFYVHHWMTIYLKKYIDSRITISKSWVLWVDGRKEHTNWHTHNADYSLVYYLQTTAGLNSGTCFKHGFEKVDQNGMIVFPSNMLHSSPSYDGHHDRYVMGMDMIIKH